MRYLAEMAFRYDEDGTLVKKTTIYKEVPDTRFEEMVHSALAPWIYGINVTTPNERASKRACVGSGEREDQRTGDKKEKRK